MKKHIRLLSLAAISLAGFYLWNQLQASSPDNAIFSYFQLQLTVYYNDNKLSQMNFHSPTRYPDPRHLPKKEMIIMACSSFRYSGSTYIPFDRSGRNWKLIRSRPRTSFTTKTTKLQDQ